MSLILGVDPARLGQDNTALIIVETGEINKVIFIKELSKYTLDKTAEYIIYLHNKYKFSKIIIDQTGLGAGLLDFLSRKFNVPKEINQTNYKQSYVSNDVIIGMTFTIETKMAMFGSLKLLMEQGKIKIPNHIKLIYQLKDFRYEISKTSDRLIKLHHSQGGHDDLVDALVLAIHGANRNKELSFFFG